MEHNESIKYIEDVLKNWEQWQTHHKILMKSLRDALSIITELTENNEYLKTQLTATEAMLSEYRSENERLKEDKNND